MEEEEGKEQVNSSMMSATERGVLCRRVPSGIGGEGVREAERRVRHAELCCARPSIAASTRDFLVPHGRSFSYGGGAWRAVVRHAKTG